MATIKERKGKNGTTYLIRASCGYDVSGKHVEKSMTWKPAPGMTARQIQKELNKQAVLFEAQCAAAGVGNGNIKFETFARQWIKEYAEAHNRPRTVARLHQLEPRTYAALGHIRVDRITSRQIQRFIDSLAEDGVSQKNSYAMAKQDIKALLHTMQMTQRELSEKSGVSSSTISSLCRGERITQENARKVCEVLGYKEKELFTIQKQDGHLARKSIQHYLSFVSSVMDYAFRFEMIPMNPCKRVVIPGGEQSERECYTLEEAQRFLESLEKAPVKYRTFFVLVIYGGFRRGEVLGLEWQDIDFRERTIKIQRTSQYLKEKGIYTDDTKTRKSKRVLKLPEVVFDALRKHRVGQMEERLLNGDRWQDTGRLFTQDDGTPMHPNTPYQWLRKFCKQTDQRFLGVHMFRHLNASLLISSGTDVKTVSSTLGHSQVTTTLNIYAHTFAEAQIRASEAVGDMLGSKKHSAG